MAKSTTDYLIELSEVDQRIALLERAGAQIEEERQAKFQELEVRRSRLCELEGLHQEAVTRQKGEEEKLRTEEQKMLSAESSLLLSVVPKWPRLWSGRSILPAVR